MLDNARVMALAGAAEHIAAGAPLYHPGMRDATMLTVRFPGYLLFSNRAPFLKLPPTTSSRRVQGPT